MNTPNVEPITETTQKAAQLCQAGRYREAAHIILRAAGLEIPSYCGHLFRQPGDRYCTQCGAKLR